MAKKESKKKLTKEQNAKLQAGSEDYRANATGQSNKRLTITPDMRETVSLARVMGMTAERIQKLIINPETDKPISSKLLYKHFKKEIQEGADILHNQVLKSLYNTAINGKGKEATTAAIFLAKTKLGFKETTVTELTGKDGSPVTFADLAKNADKAEKAKLSVVVPIGAKKKANKK